MGSDSRNIRREPNPARGGRLGPAVARDVRGVEIGAAAGVGAECAQTAPFRGR